MYKYIILDSQIREKQGRLYRTSSYFFFLTYKLLTNIRGTHLCDVLIFPIILKLFPQNIDFFN